MVVKGQMPAHIKRKIFQHPNPNLQLIQILENISDPRKPSCNFQHSLTSIVFIVIVTSLCGADDWLIIETLAISMKDWIARFVDISSGIPSAHTIERVFSLIAPEAMESVLIETMALLREKKEKVISFDGKTLCGTLDDSAGKKAIHILNAWSRENGICIGHKKVDDKSNEITAMPELMKWLDLEGAIVTTDALNTQKEIAKEAIKKGADYLLPVKGNHKGLQEDIELLFKEAQKNEFKGIDADQYETLEKSRSRVEKRWCCSIGADDLPDKEKWPGVKSLGMIRRERTLRGKPKTETVFYISSCEINAELLGTSVRDHWQIENGLHWSLDVVFREDKSRYRHDVGARNLAVVRKIVLGALSRDKSRKCGKANKRVLAAADPFFREEILENLF
jgi:predicted transposase YbfD/YdcC